MARRALGPATLSVVHALEAALDPGDRALLVACSGGADSLALSAATVQVLRRRGLVGSAVVVDHALQADSAAIASRARQQVVQLGIADVAIRRVAVDAHSGVGPEGAARDARYGALEAEAERRDSAGATADGQPVRHTILLGHTLDDQAETVLLGLARGSGIRSLAGMPARAGRYLRPLLTVRRRTTEQVCAELGLEPWQDPHNADDTYARSRVRARVLPLLESQLGPGIAESLSRTAQLARDDADLMDALAARAQPAGSESLDCGLLIELPAAVRRRVIRSWLRDRGAPEASFVHVGRVEELVTRWHGQLGADVAGLRVRRRDGRLVCDG